MDIITKTGVRLALASAFAGTLCAAANAADEAPLDRYTYYPDGTYVAADAPDAAGTMPLIGFGEAAISAYRVDGVDDANHTGFLRGSLAATLRTNILVQADLRYGTALNDDIDTTSVSAEAHAAYLRPDNFAVGGYLGTESATSGDLDVSVVSYGVEAAKFVNRATLLARVGTTDEDVDTLTLEGEARFYANDNLRFDARLGHTTITEGDIEVGLTRTAVRGNYRLAAKPVTFFGQYAQYRTTASVGSFDIEGPAAHEFMAGARWSFGSTSIRDEERRGALWSPATGSGN